MARKERLLSLRIVAVFAVLVLTAAACNNGSSTVTGPSGGGTASVNVAGSWSGGFHSDDAMTCGSSTATAVFQQVGSEVKGNLQTSECGVHGYFSATISGNSLTGSVAMEGCVGGKLSGTINGSTLTFAVADLTKPLVTADRSIMPGGVVTLTR
jgi:hypothetical protein